MATDSVDMTPHKIEAEAELSPHGKKAFQFIEFDENEQLEAEIRKHPVGLVLIIISGAFVALAILIAVTVAALNVNKLGFDFGDSEAAIRTGLMVVGLILVGLIGIMTIITAIIYRANVIFLTDDKLAEVTYLSLFNRRVIQQNIGRVEDVTVIQRGILPRVFDYGTLVVETAGEKERLTFTLIPRPSQNSKLIIKCHEEYIKKYGN